jgi:hypothetical protein
MGRKRKERRGKKENIYTLRREGRKAMWHVCTYMLFRILGSGKAEATKTIHHY